MTQTGRSGDEQETRAPGTKGLIMIFTGNGKGKTTAALGMALRAWGHGMRVLIIQFLKSAQDYGEVRAIRRLDEKFKILSLGAGFVRGGGKDLDIHREAANMALAAARREIETGDWNVIILDEINVALSMGLLTIPDVLALFQVKPPHLHLVLTGRGAPAELVASADLVTEMVEVKHPFHSGITAQPGVEY